MRKLCAISCLLLLTSFLFTAIAGAQVTVNTDIPGVTGNTQGGTGICKTVFGFYNFALAFGGVLALGAITYGGVKYTMAAGNPSGQSEGKAWVRDALLGLLLLAGAYLILNIINPDITKCGLPERLERLSAAPADAPIGVPVSSLTSCTPALGGPAGTCKNCRNSPAVNTILGCVGGDLRMAGVTATTYGGQHTCDAIGNRVSCHFGGKFCDDGAHAVDWGINALQAKGLTLSQGISIAQGCLASAGGGSCFCEDPGGNRMSCTDPRANHIHCNVATAACGCN